MLGLYLWVLRPQVVQEGSARASGERDSRYTQKMYVVYMLSPERADTLQITLAKIAPINGSV